MNFTKYLFCYFTGNEPENESVHFALSTDGYNFTFLNKNRPVITQNLGRKCCRDPYIFRGVDGVFHIIATDMRCYDGWANNTSMVVWDSDDLVNWKNERILDFSKYPETASANRVWAPQVVYDNERQEYMIYWSHSNADDDFATIPWYAYTKDFITLTTKPAVLFNPKSNLAAIDGDIIEHDGKFYLFTADEEKDGICYCISEMPCGPYYEPENNKISLADTALEGHCIYKILGTDKFVMIADQFKKGGYFMQESDDLIHFKKVDKEKISLDHLKPRHGSVMHITDEEYERLVKAFG